MNHDNDVQKLHAEGLQLRNQQFYLGTIALAGSGLTALIAPAATALTQGEIPQSALIGGALSWLVLLTLLFRWSLALRKLMSIISRYLELRELSQWEPDFRNVYEQKDSGFPSQTRFIALAFGLYGVLAVGSAMLAAYASHNIHLDMPGHIGLGLSLIAYLIYTWCGYSSRAKVDSKIEEAWRLRLGLPTQKNIDRA